MRELERDLPTDAATSLRDEPLPALAIVGAGRMGGALARAAAKPDLAVALTGRDDAVKSCRVCEAALLCVPDAAVAEAAAAIREAVPPLRLVGHTSGATGMDALSAAAERGAATFWLHPLQTVPRPDADLSGASCAVGGSDEEAERFATRLAERLGLRPFPVPQDRRVAYHAAAAMASNFLVALEESAAELLERAGIEDPRELLAPLVLRTAGNWVEDGGAALTGPIARGDAATVARHLEAIHDLAPELEAMYEALAARTREIARSHGR